MQFAVDCVVFDIGNTLNLDPFDVAMGMKSLEMKKAFSAKGYDFSEQQIIDAWTSANHDINYPFISHFYQEKPILHQCMEQLKVPRERREGIISSLLLIYRTALPIIINRDNRLVDIRRMLRDLGQRGKRLMVFSNERQRSLELFLRWAGLSDYFPVVTSSEKLGYEKPDPMVFKYLIKASGTSPGRIAYVGDDPANDISPAKDAGMLAIQYIPPESKPMPWRDYKKKAKHPPDAVFQRFWELCDIII